MNEKQLTSNKLRALANELAKSLKNPEDLSQFDWMLKMKPYSMLIWPIILGARKISLDLAAIPAMVA